MDRSVNWIAGQECGLDCWTGVWIGLMDRNVDWIDGQERGLDCWTGAWIGLMNRSVDWIDGQELWCPLWDSGRYYAGQQLFVLNSDGLRTAHAQSYKRLM